MPGGLLLEYAESLSFAVLRGTVVALRASQKSMPRTEGQGPHHKSVERLRRSPLN